MACVCHKLQCKPLDFTKHKFPMLAWMPIGYCSMAGQAWELESRICMPPKYKNRKKCLRSDGAGTKEKVKEKRKRVKGKEVRRKEREGRGKNSKTRSGIEPVI